MTLERLNIRGFRNLAPNSLVLNPRCNIICGANGSGKTNLLEAIHLLCGGKSFRTSKLEQCIPTHNDSWLIQGQFSDYQAGIEKTRRNLRVRIDEKDVERVSQLAEKTPVTILNEKGFELICGPPIHRRAFIDWIVFHVEHNYRHVWNQYNRIVKQKTRLLKSHASPKEISLWNSQQASVGVQLQEYRETYIQQINQQLSLARDESFADSPVWIDYQKGWSSDNPEESLQQGLEREVKMGFCMQGPHRDRLNIHQGDLAVCGHHSRGQIRRIGMMCLIASVCLVKETTAKPMVVLLDDLESELDQKTIEYVLVSLRKTGAQLIITNINQRDYLTDFFEENKMFHVEHGIIHAVENS